MEKFINQLHSLIDLRIDTNYSGTDESIRQNVNFKSANAWTLVFAIFIASVGLNVNSTAVIIGAMLISPLMGPIVGAGYALGINDFELLKRSGKNLMYAVLISLITSTLYFVISPFTEVQNELLARTSPNFYDVVIAFFGGAAGIVALSRSEKSNAIPGVAIATALMPPLCTAGFGIATLEWRFLVGAFYLFVINSVFICLSTYIFIRYLKFPKVSYSNKFEQKKINRWIVGTSIAVVIPSFFTAWLLLAQSTFRHRANRFIDEEVKFKGTFIVDKKYIFDLENSRIQLKVIGKKLSSDILEELQQKKNFYKLKNVKLEIDQLNIDDRFDKEIKDIDRNKFEIKRTSDFELEIDSLKDDHSLIKKLVLEAQTFMPLILELHLNKEALSVIWGKQPKLSDRVVVERFIRLRFKKELNFSHSVLIRESYTQKDI